MSLALTSPFRTEFFPQANRATRSRPVQKSTITVAAAAPVGPATNAAEERGLAQSNLVSRNDWFLRTL